MAIYPEDFLASIPYPHHTAVLGDTLIDGMDSPRLSLALYVCDKLLADMDRALDASNWLAGDRISLADLALGL